MLSANLASSIGQAKMLGQTYIPVDAQMVRCADDARKHGRVTIRANEKGEDASKVLSSPK